MISNPSSRSFSIVLFVTILCGRSGFENAFAQNHPEYRIVGVQHSVPDWIHIEVWLVEGKAPTDPEIRSIICQLMYSTDLSKANPYPKISVNRSPLTYKNVMIRLWDYEYKSTNLNVEPTPASQMRLEWIHTICAFYLSTASKEARFYFRDEKNPEGRRREVAMALGNLCKGQWDQERIQCHGK